MPQRTVIELLALKLSGEATPRDLAELEEMIAKNPDAVYHEELLRQVFLNETAASANHFQYNRHRLKYQDSLIFAEQNVTAFNQLRLGKYLVAAIGLTLILVAVTLFLYQHKYDKNSTQYNTQVIAGNAVRKKVLLPDGTQVWLNSESKLVYDKDMDKRRNREVMLTGEAFFDVTHNQKHPFIIRTNKINVKVLGTAFNIKAYPNDQKTETTLIRGSIELTVNDRKTEKVILKPQEKFALIDQNIKSAGLKIQADQSDRITMMVQNVLPVRVSGKEYTEEVSWVNNELVFSNETFAELAPKMERWYNIRINIQNSNLNNYHFTGVFTKEKLAEALTAMKLIRPFNFKISEHDVTIY